MRIFRKIILSLFFCVLASLSSGSASTHDRDVDGAGGGGGGRGEGRPHHAHSANPCTWGSSDVAAAAAAASGGHVSTSGGVYVGRTDPSRRLLQGAGGAAGGSGGGTAAGVADERRDGHLRRRLARTGRFLHHISEHVAEALQGMRTPGGALASREQLIDLAVRIDAVRLYIQRLARFEVEGYTRVLVVGPTGAGKDTFVNAMARRALRSQMGAICPGEDGLLPGFEIGNSGTSVTTNPVPWRDEENRIFYWNCPGFDHVDTDGEGSSERQALINAFAMDYLLCIPGNTKVLLLIDYPKFGFPTSRADTLLPIFQQLEQLVSPADLIARLRVVVSASKGDHGDIFRRFQGKFQGFSRRCETVRLLLEGPDAHQLFLPFPEPEVDGPYRSFDEGRTALVEWLRPQAAAPHDVVRGMVPVGSRELVYLDGLLSDCQGLRPTVQGYFDAIAAEAGSLSLASSLRIFREALEEFHSRFVREPRAFTPESFVDCFEEDVLNRHLRASELRHDLGHQLCRLTGLCQAIQLIQKRTSGPPRLKGFETDTVDVVFGQRGLFLHLKRKVAEILDNKELAERATTTTARAEALERVDHQVASLEDGAKKKAWYWKPLRVMGEFAKKVLDIVVEPIGKALGAFVVGLLSSKGGGGGS